MYGSKLTLLDNEKELYGCFCVFIFAIIQINIFLSYENVKNF